MSTYNPDNSLLENMKRVWQSILLLRRHKLTLVEIKFYNAFFLVEIAKYW